MIAESFERIHRSNLVGMGVAPLQLDPGVSAASLGLTGRERYELRAIGPLAPRQRVRVTATPDDGSGGAPIVFEVTSRLDGPIEVDYFRNGGIMPTVLGRLAAD